MQVKVVGVVSTVRLARGETAVVERTPMVDALVAAGFVRIEPVPVSDSVTKPDNGHVNEGSEIPAAPDDEVVEIKPARKAARRRG